ncbi:Ferredoxin subunit of nitrite reductase or a ring-hydroxylating dioxygenase [Jatrophihabitans endophyticus]|uniref:Ferredoxin subunit of nitrite reductase or a ring-hydroxylating dioxygenase n=1 Tax=Jatrophihabitans endophyticus TaxID=1206085 RepID=A0A1M5Q8D0_9ACTN|nr:Rieske 2Fe-2S domain-containing protein [Jatrophihabitans endophyticus]SHH10262.1 Ferredoxin subunit of nitrite reductase or a ring-hydroxylating dioxygenase [Jatrophihabitans endophyticus]
MRTSTLLERLVTRIEHATVLDAPAEAYASVLRTVVRPGPVEDTLSGVPVGHPVHPALVAVPIGAWVSAGVLDAQGERGAARRLVGLGVLAALPTAATGGSDYLTTAGAERRVGFVHAATNLAAIASYGVSWLLRRRGNDRAGVVASLVGATALGAGGWLGGHLAYAQGVGVDTTAFQKLPTEWTEAAQVADLPTDGSPSEVEVDGVPLLVAALDGAWVAMADRCTHRGAPLHEGTVEDGCIVCPWHDSAFALADGSVRSGPATRPQPSLETRQDGGRLLVRRSEERTLRTNPTGR